LIGRASYGNPYIFRGHAAAHTAAHTAAHIIAECQPEPLQEHDRYAILHIAVEHARLYEQSFGHLERYRFLPMRKHLGWYVRNLPGAGQLRRTLTMASTLGEAESAINEYLLARRN
jgi:tRNA-dihydrouridine synthase B